MTQKYMRYRVEEIEELFKEYRDYKNWHITDREFKILCNALCVAPKEVIDRVLAEVYIVALSLRKNRKAQIACFLNYAEEELNNKKGIIFYSSVLFSTKALELFPIREILHEIAHYILNHSAVNGEEEATRIEKEADNLAKDWIQDWFCNLGGNEEN